MIGGRHGADVPPISIKRAEVCQVARSMASRPSPQVRPVLVRVVIHVRRCSATLSAGDGFTSSSGIQQSVAEGNHGVAALLVDHCHCSRRGCIARSGLPKAPAK